MTTTRHGSRGPQTFLTAAFVVLMAALFGSPSVSAQWTQPDAANNISNTNSGNVGVGTTVPNFKFEVRGSSSRNTIGVTGDGDSVGYAGIHIGAFTTTNIPNNRTLAFMLSMRKDTWYGGDGSGPSFIIETGTKGGGFAAPFMITPTNDILLNSGRGAGGPAGAVPSYGNVGIGTHTPVYKLDVNGSVNSSGGFCIAGDCKTAWSQVSGFAASGSNLYFNTGNVGFGTTSPAFKLDSTGAIRGIGETQVNITNQYAFTGGGQQHYFDGGVPFAPLGRGSANAYYGTSTGVGSNPGAIFVGGFGSQSAGAAAVYAQGGDTHSEGYNRAWGGVGLFAQGGQNGPHTGGPYGWAYSRYAAAAFFNGYVQIGSNDGRLNGLAIGFDGFNGYGAKLPPSGGLLINGSVGVGTATPSYKLDVQGGQVNASGGLCIAGDCRVSWSQVAGGSGATQWSNGSNGVISYSAGNVGVGTTAPAAKLSVGGAGTNVYNTDLWLENNAHVQGNESLTQGGRGRMRVGTAWGYVGLYADVSSTGVPNDLVLGAGSGNVRVGPNAVAGGTAQHLLVPNGNVGIGTTTPASKLYVGGGSMASATLPGVNVGLGGPSYVSASNGTVNTFFGSDGSPYGIVGTLTNHPLGLRANNTLAMTLMPDGKVGVGNSAPAHKLDVTGNVNASGLCIGGDCKTAWSQVGGGTTSQWANGASSSINYTAGAVGIGTASPADRLEVNGFGEVKTRVVGTISAGIQFRETTDANTWSEWQQYFDRFRLNVHDGTTTRPDVISVLPNGNIGIRKVSPTVALDVVGDIKATGSVSATYQDVAEWVPSTQKLQAGTVVVLDTGKNNHVVASASPYDTKVAGVVSARPGVILGEGGEGKVMVATTGRVKVKVDATRGAIKVGDLLVTSEVEGVAMKSEPIVIGGRQMHAPGTIIGKALEPLEKGTGEILVLLSLQ